MRLDLVDLIGLAGNPVADNFALQVGLIQAGDALVIGFVVQEDVAAGHVVFIDRLAEKGQVVGCDVLVLRVGAQVYPHRWRGVAVRPT